MSRRNWIRVFWLAILLQVIGISLYAMSDRSKPSTFEEECRTTCHPRVGTLERTSYMPPSSWRPGYWRTRCVCAEEPK